MSDKEQLAKELKEIIGKQGGPAAFTRKMSVIGVPLSTVKKWNGGFSTPQPWVIELIKSHLLNNP